MVVTDLEKTYNKGPRDFVWWILNKRSVPEYYIEESYLESELFIKK